MIIKNKQVRAQYKAAGQLSTEILWRLYEAVAPGVLPIELDAIAAQECQRHGVKPSFLGVKGQHGDYRYSTCIQINEEVVHGIPSSTRRIQSGDLVTVDFGIIVDGLYTDHCFTVGVGTLSSQDQRLLEVGRETVVAATKQAVVGQTTGDIGFTMLETAEQAGFTTVKKYIGHGIGRSLHESPEVPTFGEPGEGVKLEKGTVLCVEAQVMAGSDQVVTGRDGWTVTSKDGSNSVMFEYMVVVGKRQPLLLTPTMNWPLIKA